MNNLRDFEAVGGLTKTSSYPFRFNLGKKEKPDASWFKAALNDIVGRTQVDLCGIDGEVERPKYPCREQRGPRGFAYKPNAAQ